MRRDAAQMEGAGPCKQPVQNSLKRSLERAERTAGAERGWFNERGDSVAVLQRLRWGRRETRSKVARPRTPSGRHQDAMSTREGLSNAQKQPETTAGCRAAAVWPLAARLSPLSWYFCVLAVCFRLFVLAVGPRLSFVSFLAAALVDSQEAFSHSPPAASSNNQ